MDVSEFVDMCTDYASLVLHIWSIDLEKNIYEGPASDIPDDIGVMEVESFDPPSGENTITVNV